VVNIGTIFIGDDMAVRYKKFGNQEYAYEIWNEKIEETGRWKQRSRYLGVVVDKEKGVYEKRNEVKRLSRRSEQKEREILDYGDSYFFNEFLKKDEIYPILRSIFGNHMDTLLSLVLYKLQGGCAMRNAEVWYDGNAASILFPDAAMTSQNISDFLNILGNDKLQRGFFQEYIKSVCGDKSGIIIDSTGLENQINMPITAWGHHNGDIEMETRLILAVSKEAKKPLYFRYAAGNIGDVSTLTTTICELKKFGVLPTISIIDAGYYSEGNINALYEGKVSFLTRMPSSRVIYKSLIKEHSSNIETKDNAVIYGERGLFIHKTQIDLYGHPAFAYIVCDPVRRGREISKKIIDSEQKKDDFELQNCGMMILVTNEDIEKKDIVPLYYSRQMAEQLFGIAKDDLNLLPLRTHGETRFRGLMMLSFISLIIYLKLKETIGNKVTVEQTLALMRNLKCKIFHDNSIIVAEVNKKQRIAFETNNILVPKNCGV
jgi:transposase